MIEVLCGMAVFGTVVIALYAGISSGFAVLESARENLRATQILVERMESIRLKTFEQLDDPLKVPRTFTEYYNYKDTSGFAYSGRVTVQPASFTDAPNYQGDMKMVQIDLTWKATGPQRTRTMTTYVTRNGLQNYVF